MKDYVLLSNEELFAFAMLDFKKGNYEGSLIKIKTILARGDFPSDVFALAGKVYASIELFDQARAALTRFVSDVPDAYVERFQLGMVEKDSGNEAEAEKIWLQVLETQESYPPALYHLGELHFGRGEMEQAKNYLNLILEHAPDDSEYIAHADQLLMRVSLQ